MIKVIKFICQLIRPEWKIEEQYYPEYYNALEGYTSNFRKDLNCKPTDYMNYQIDFGRRESPSGGYVVIEGFSSTDKPNYKFEAWVIMLKLCFRWLHKERF